MHANKRRTEKENLQPNEEKKSSLGNTQKKSNLNTAFERFNFFLFIGIMDAAGASSKDRGCRVLGAVASLLLPRKGMTGSMGIDNGWDQLAHGTGQRIAGPWSRTAKSLGKSAFPVKVQALANIPVGSMSPGPLKAIVTRWNCVEGNNVARDRPRLWDHDGSWHGTVDHVIHGGTPGHRGRHVDLRTVGRPVVVGLLQDALQRL